MIPYLSSMIENTLQTPIEHPIITAPPMDFDTSSFNSYQSRMREVFHDGQEPTLHIRRSLESYDISLDSFPEDHRESSDHAVAITRAIKSNQIQRAATICKQVGFFSFSLDDIDLLMEIYLIDETRSLEQTWKWLELIMYGQRVSYKGQPSGQENYFLQSLTSCKYEGEHEKKHHIDNARFKELFNRILANIPQHNREFCFISPLIEAISYDDFDMVVYFLSLGASPDTQREQDIDVDCLENSKNSIHFLMLSQALKEKKFKIAWALIKALAVDPTKLLPQNNPDCKLYTDLKKEMREALGLDKAPKTLKALCYDNVDMLCYRKYREDMSLATETQGFKHLKKERTETEHLEVECRKSERLEMERIYLGELPQVIRTPLIQRRAVEV